MRVASVYYRDYAENSLFTPGAGENNGEFYLPYAKLRERFLAAGIELNTPDVNAGRAVEFELHINCRRQDPSARAYVYLYENPLIRPLNRDRAALARYAKWFAWDGALRDDPRTVSLLYPNRFDTEGWSGPEKRPLFCVLVASNKALTVVDPRDQYQARVRILDGMSATRRPTSISSVVAGIAPLRCPAAGVGSAISCVRTLARFLPAKSPYATWRGPVDDKIELLTRARFCLAHENCRDLTGYVTEKLFDCFRAGCVPVYVGPKEVADLVPADCFIDGRAYETPAALDAFLRTIDDAAYRGYQERIRAFLLSAQAKPFSQDHFADVLAQEIIADLPAAR
jgi:alpha(1,3/1,4) fucosyltransferase